MTREEKIQAVLHEVRRLIMELEHKVRRIQSNSKN